MPDNTFEPRLLDLLERCAAALERIAANTEPVREIPAGQPTQ